MKINLIKVNFKGNYRHCNYENYVYKFLPFNFCCENIKNDKNIVFTDNYNEKYDDVNYKAAYEADMKFQDIIGPDDDIGCYIYPMSFPRYCKIIDHDLFFSDIIPINWCPYCGEKIEIKIVMEVDASSEHLAIDKKMNLLQDAIDKVHNDPKQEEKIYEKIREVEREYDWFMKLSSVF
jgi:hypothetical protein